MSAAAFDWTTAGAWVLAGLALAIGVSFVAWLATGLGVLVTRSRATARERRRRHP
jgi:ribose 1,5-bisphosphokinase PhnN